MEDNINTKVVETKIPIGEIINQTLMQMPKQNVNLIIC